MYHVNLGDKILYYPANDEFAIYDTELTEDIGIAGEFTFRVPPTNLLYNELSNGKLITILKDKKEFWRGEIRDITIDFAKIATVYVVEDVAWLGDEFIPPAKIINQTYKQRLDAVIQTYNSTRPASRQFRSGSVYNGSSICNWQTEYEWSILDSIRKCICRDDYYIKVRRTVESGITVRYIDIVRLQEYGKSTTQPIEYGYNLLDYVKESDYGNLTNVLTPYGEELEDREVYTDYSERLQGTTIQNNASINAYGRHAKAVVFDGVTNVNTLNNLAASYLSRYSQPQLTMEVKAVDLSMVENIQDIAIGDRVHIIAKPFAVDQELYLTEIVRDLQNVDKNTLTLSGHVTRKTLTSQLLQATDDIEEIPSEWDLLKAAKKNALAMLLDETQGGYVVFEYDDPTNPSMMTAINICNMPEISKSTKRWRWSQNGLGYLERRTINDSWPTGSNIKAAMTADGHIVADRVDTGNLTAAVITTGILKDRQNQFSLNMETGALTMNSGTFKGTLSGASGTFAGSLSAASGTFAGNLSAAGGTFTGSLSAASGTFKGAVKIGDKSAYTDGNTGVYIGSEGMSLGRNNTFNVSNAGEITAVSGSIGGFTITSDHIGDEIGSDECVGMEAGRKLFAYDSSGSSVHKVNIFADSIDLDNAHIFLKYGSSNITITSQNIKSSDQGYVEWEGSDARLKENIEDLTLEEAKRLIESVNPRKFKFKAEDGERYGFIAQELREVLDDDSAIEYGDNIRNIHYHDFIAPLCMMVNSLQKEIDQLKGERNG